MKILLISDEEDIYLWDFYRPGRLDGIDMILSAGDLKASYLSFLVTMGNVPLFYVHGNHDISYDQAPPEGCDCVDDKLVVYKGLRILGLGGCMKYNGSKYQYSEKEMSRRIRKLRRKIKKAGGVDIILTHAPVRGIGDEDTLAHMGFECFRNLIEEYRPRIFVHGHIHKSYGVKNSSRNRLGETEIINACGKCIIEV